MLTTIRSYSSSPIVKALFVILVLSFGIWGVADVVQPGGSQDWAAKVGSSEIPRQRFEEEYREALRRLRAATGSDIDAEQARSLKLADSVLSRLVKQEVLAHAAGDLNITTSDESLRQLIASEPQFQNSLGLFDKTVFNDKLRQAGMTEPQFIAFLRRDMLQQQLVSSVSAGFVLPDAVKRLIASHLTEMRRIAYAAIVFDQQKINKSPSTEELLAFHEQNPELLKSPEFRKLTYVDIRSSDYIDRVTVAAADAKAFYDNNVSQFTVSEQRSFWQAVADSETKAEALRQTLSKLGPQQPAAALAAGFAVIGPVQQSQLPAGLGAAVFSATPQIAQVVQSPLGWHVVAIKEVIAGSITPFAQVEAQITADLKQQKAVEAMIDQSNQLDDSLGRNIPLAEAAASLNLKLRTIDGVDAAGRSPAGQLIEPLPARFLDVAFKTAEGATSPLIEVSPNELFVLHVDKIIPAAPRPFAAAEADVRTQWLAAQQQQQARARAAELRDKITGSGMSLAAAARSLDLRSGEIASISRDQLTQRQALPSDVLSRVFDEPAGPPVEVTSGRAVYVVTSETLTASGSSAAAAVPEAQLGLYLAGVQEDAITQFIAAEQKNTNVEINTTLLNQLSQ
jgi:peptidyl-prolyl cis-trans isomerase D